MSASDEQRDDNPQRPSFKRIVQASALAAVFGRTARKEKRSRHPQVVRTGPEVDAVVQVAEELAELGRDDEAAVEQLRAVAKGRTGVLNRALALSRMGPEVDGSLFDLRAGDLMERLLIVLPWQVVEAAHGWVALECGVAAVMVVGVEPAGKRGEALAV